MRPVSLALLVLLIFPPQAMSFELSRGVDPENTLVMQLKGGEVVIRLRPDLAPSHVAQIKNLVRAGYYDSKPFHRVVENFVAQMGDLKDDGEGQSDLPNIKATYDNKTEFKRGSVGMALDVEEADGKMVLKDGQPVMKTDSANAQLFFVETSADLKDEKAAKRIEGLNERRLPYVGDVVSGMEYVDAVKHGDMDKNGVVQLALREKIMSIKVAADLQPKPKS